MVAASKTAQAPETADAAVLEEILEALIAARDGDFSRRLSRRRRGLVGEIGAAYNELVSTNARMEKELARMRRVVGREGRMDQRASMGAAGGGWESSTESLNALIDDLVRPTTEVARVLDAVAEGDLDRKMALTIEGQPVKGEFLRIGTTVNTMVDQLSAFAAEVTRVAREVGTDGKLGGQAEVKGVSGTWRDLTESVNGMASNLTDQVRNISYVAQAVAQGDLSQKITVEAKGEVAELADTMNGMTDTLAIFADQVTSVAREVGTDGKLGGQAEVPNVAGTWKDLTDSVNLMASNLTDQVRNIAEVTTAVANGDLSQKITVDVKGEILELKETTNTMVDQLSAFAAEVTRVAREVGTEGILGGQAEVADVSGTWRDLTESVNGMASNLTDQVRNIAYVAQAVAQGDLSQKITVEAKGEVAELADTMNAMTDTLAIFADQVTSVAREVGTEGKLGGQAEVPNVAGTWKDLTDSVNLMASNLTDQVRNIAEVTTAVANGDLTQKITVDVKGEILELKETANTMVDQLSAFADEVTRVAREVGTEGILGGQAEVKGVSGTWRDLTAERELHGLEPHRPGALDRPGLDRGGRGRPVAEDRGRGQGRGGRARGHDQQDGRPAALVRGRGHARGARGGHRGQARRPGRGGGRVGHLARAHRERELDGVEPHRPGAQHRRGDHGGGQRRPVEEDHGRRQGRDPRAQGARSTRWSTSSTPFAAEVTRVSKEVGTDGKLGGQAEVEDVSGTWRSLTESVNYMASNLTDQVRSIALVTTAVANGDLSRKITVDAKGEILELKNTINTMVDQLNSFAAEVTRVAKEVGTEGALGGQAEVAGVSGTWRGLTESVNMMASNLTDQVRNISQVAQAVARGDLTQKITVDAKGEILELKQVLNTMVDQLSSFADEVTRVAKEVGTEGKLGGQAQVEDVSGTWRGLTENVNQLASNLTTQVRAIAEVSTAVTQGDLTRSITVEASGEVADLSDNINQMIANLRETTRQNEEQDWLKTNLARISSLMQGQRDLETVSQLIMSELSPAVFAQHGAFFLSDHEEEGTDFELRLLASLRLLAPQGGVQPLPPRRRAGGPGRAREEADPDHRPARGLHRRGLGPGRGHAAQHHRDPGAVRGPGAGRDRAGLVPPLQRGDPRLPGPAHRDDRRDAVHDHRQRPHRAAARAVADAVAGAPGPVAGAPGPAGGAAGHQRGAPGEGGAARDPEPRHRDQEPRDRRGAALARGEGRAARAVLEVQERVPGQHVARAAHAAQLAADPLEGAVLQRERQPVREADRLRGHDPQRGLRPARADQRHPRPLEGRGRQDGRARDAHLAGRRARLRRALLPAGGRGEGPDLRRGGRVRARRRRSRPTSSACSRCSRTCSRTRSSSPTPAA